MTNKPKWADEVNIKWNEELDQLTMQQCERTWRQISSDYKNNNLADEGVELPKTVDFRIRGKEVLTAKALWLIASKRIEGQAFTIEAMTKLVEYTLPECSGTQQVRHLGRQDGWYVLNKGDIIPGTTHKMPSGWHMLVNTTQAKPGYRGLTRKARKCAQNQSFQEKKEACGYVCLTCGCKEGEMSRIDPTKIVVLVEGHMDPQGAATAENSFPQCTVCNSHQSDWVYDADGQARTVSSSRPISRATPEVKKEIAMFLIDDLDEDVLIEMAKTMAEKLGPQTLQKNGLSEFSIFAPENS